MESADDRAPRADSPDATTLADIGIAGPSAPTVSRSGSVDLKRARLIRAWAQTTASRPDPAMLRGYDPRYACPDMTRERAAAEAAAAAAMARMGPID